MNVVRCKNGHFFDADVYNDCPHCVEGAIFREGLDGRRHVKKSTVYYWNPATMSIDNIVGFLVHFEPDAGRPPIVEVAFDGEKFLVKNTINGSRDGGKSFSEDFFKERCICLSQEQIWWVHACLRSIHLESWSTPDTIQRYLEAPPPGFCSCNDIAVTFANGSRFECYSPPGKEFHHLVYLLCNLCELKRETTGREPTWDFWDTPSH